MKLNTKNIAILTVLVVILSALLIGLALAQRPRGGGGHRKANADGYVPIYEVPKNQPDLSGRVSLPRMRFDVSMYGGFGMHLGDGGLPWSHDFPGAQRHLMKIVRELSKVDVVLDTNENIFGFDEPELFKYPIVYLCEIGAMNLSDPETSGWREYCQRGGMVIVDDFRGPRDMANLQAHLKRVFPDIEMKKLDVSHPIFNCFFSIKSLDLKPMYGGGFGTMEFVKPEFYGIEDKDGRLMVVMNYNYDVSDFWQFSDNAFAPIEETNEAYKFGVNYLVYALTH
ncbi:MAG: DUF4159 domain-containing protein [Blastocatellia bacterium]